MTDETFEALAAAFRRETGVWPPGKDRPAAMGSDGVSDEERMRQWRCWCAARAPRAETHASAHDRDCILVDDHEGECRLYRGWRDEVAAPSAPAHASAEGAPRAGVPNWTTRQNGIHVCLRCGQDISTNITPNMHACAPAAPASPQEAPVSGSLRPHRAGQPSLAPQAAPRARDRWATPVTEGEAAGCYPCDTCNGFRAAGLPCNFCSGARASFAASEAEVERLRGEAAAAERAGRALAASAETERDQAVRVAVAERDAWSRRAEEAEEVFDGLQHEANNQRENADAASLSLARLRERIEGLFDKPWSVADVLEELAGAAEHLISEHSCDAHGWEAVNGCVPRAREYATALRSLLGGEEGGG